MGERIIRERKNTFLEILSEEKYNLQIICMYCCVFYKKDI